MGLNCKRCDLFPVGTTVKCFASLSTDRRRGHKPSGTAIAEATVDANGNLAFPTVEEGKFELWAEVAGAEVFLFGGSENFVPLLNTPAQLTYGTGYLNRLGAVSVGYAPGTGPTVGRQAEVAGGQPNAMSSGVLPAPLAERIQAQRLFQGCAVRGLPYS